MIPRIILTGQEHAEDIWCSERGQGIQHIISIRSLRDPIPRGLTTHPARQLRLKFDDVPWRVEDAVPVSRGQVRRLVRFSKGVQGTVLLHCAAGISRSPAAALTLIATHLGPGREVESVQHLIGLGRAVFPEPRLVFLADEVLGREGALFRAFTDAFWLREGLKETFPIDRLASE